MSLMLPQERASAALPLLRLDVLGIVSPRPTFTLPPVEPTSPTPASNTSTISAPGVASESSPAPAIAATTPAPVIPPLAEPTPTLPSIPALPNLEARGTAEVGAPDLAIVITPGTSLHRSLAPAGAVEVSPATVIPEAEFSAATVEAEGVGLEALPQLPEPSANLDSAYQLPLELPVTDLSAVVIPNPLTSGAGDVSYQIRPGDTLEQIAAVYQVSEQALIEANRLANPDVLHIDETLKIPVADTRSFRLAALTRPEGIQVLEDTVVDPQLATHLTEVSLRANGATPLPEVTLPVQAGPKLAVNRRSPQWMVKTKTLNPVVASVQTPTLTVNATGVIKPQLPLTGSEQSQVEVPQEKPWLEQRKSKLVAQATLATVGEAQQRSEQRASEPDFSVPIATRGFLPQVPRLELPPLAPADTYLPNGIFTGSVQFIWPTQGVLTSGFGPRWGRMHRGIDIAAPTGTPIMAAAPGVVTFAGWNDGGYGNLVEIRHPDGSLTLYAHNSRINTRQGQEVNQGEKIAEMGSTGRSTGPHLHFEIHPPGKGAVNPMLFLNRG